MEIHMVLLVKKTQHCKDVSPPYVLTNATFQQKHQLWRGREDRVVRVIRKLILMVMCKINRIVGKL